MALVKVSKELLEKMLFGYFENPVAIRGIDYDDRLEVIVIEIEGQDVPDVPAVEALFTEHRNQSGQVFVSGSFRPC